MMDINLGDGDSGESLAILGIGDLQMLLGECLGAGFSQNYLVSCCIVLIYSRICTPFLSLLGAFIGYVSFSERILN